MATCSAEVCNLIPLANFGCGRHRAAKPAVIDLSLTQIDPATLAELPDDVRQELLRTLAAPKPGAQRSAAAAVAAAAAALQEQEEPANGTEESARLHVADVEAAPAPPAPSGLLLRDSREKDAEQWGRLGDLFPSEFLEELLGCSAAHGWSLIEEWLNEVVFRDDNAISADCGEPECSHAGSPGVRPEQLDAIQQLLVTWATSFVADDLEGAQIVLRKLQQLGERQPVIAVACCACAEAVQAAVHKHYGAQLRT